MGIFNKTETETPSVQDELQRRNEEFREKEAEIVKSGAPEDIDTAETPEEYSKQPETLPPTPAHQSKSEDPAPFHKPDHPPPLRGDEIEAQERQGDGELDDSSPAEPAEEAKE